MIYAVIDTNVIVSSFITRHEDSATKQVIRAVYEGRVIPLYNEEIVAEYREVLGRDHIRPYIDNPDSLINFIVDHGIKCDTETWPESMPDEDDRVFFEVALGSQNDNSKLVTGNLKHFPKVNFVITPGQLLSLLV